MPVLGLGIQVLGVQCLEIHTIGFRAWSNADAGEKVAL